MINSINIHSTVVSHASNCRGYVFRAFRCCMLAGKAGCPLFKGCLSQWKDMQLGLSELSVSLYHGCLLLRSVSNTEILQIGGEAE